MRLLFLLTLAHSTIDNFCHHDPPLPVPAKAHRRLVDQPGRSLFNVNTNLAEPIRIETYYHDLKLNDAAIEADFKEVLEACVTFYTNLLKVYRITEPLKLTGVSDCFDQPIPQDHIDTGVAADIIIYVVGDDDPAQTQSATLATGGACAFDSGTIKAPIAGLFTVKSLKYLEGTYDFSTKLALCMHELAHIFAISGGLIKGYDFNGDGVVESFWQDQYNGWVRWDPSVIYEENATLRGTSDRILLKTPKVLEKVRAAFSCNSLDAMELENGGGSGTRGSHWEKYLMFNDFMVGDIGNWPTRYTDITFAAFEDSGWYVVNYDWTQPMNWPAKDEGCNIFSTECVTNGVSNFPGLFCVNSSEQGCDWTGLNSSVCSADSLMDNCSRFKAYSNGYCRNTDESNPTFASHAFGESASSSSVCLEYVQENDDSTIENKAGCYAIACNQNGFDINMDTQYFGFKQKACQQTAGEQILLEYETFTTITSRKLVCQDFNKVCPNTVPICPNSCGGRGKCLSDGTCDCMSGWGGSDCRTQQTNCSVSSCETCATDTTCSACTSPLKLSVDKTQCLQSCPTGTYDNSGICTSCGDHCADCGSDGSCTTCVTNNFTPSGTVCICGEGKYLNNNDCSQCGANCIECTSSSSCTTCRSGFIDDTNTPGACKCGDAQFQSGNTCVDCGTNCAACSDASTCTTCVGSYPNKNDGTCGCSDGQFDNGSGCTNCGDKCAICSNASSCTTCVGTYPNKNDGTCGCGSAQFDNGSGCTNCGTNCSVCSSQSTCTTCTGSYPDKNDGTCGCSSGQFDNGSGCTNCGTNCSVCTSQSACTTCTGTYPNKNDGTCGCGSGEFDNGNGCTACGTNCDVCSNNSSCTTCKFNYTDKGDGSCGCTEGQYDNGSGCTDCGEYCQTCDANGCTACLNNTLVVDSSNTANCKCSNGSTPVDNTCSGCGTNCATCSSGPSSCDSCVSPYSDKGDGSCGCPTGEYDTGSACAGCSDQNCSACNITTCTSCTSPFIPDPATPRGCTCPVKTYQDSNTTCANCGDYCNECSNSGCITCQNDTFEKDTSNVHNCKCPAATWLQGDSCVSCGTNCAACSNDTSCTTCDRDYVDKLDGTCGCPDQQIDNGTACVACGAGKYYQSGACVDCGSNCGVCSNGTSCTTCSSNYVDKSDGSCGCESGKYDDGAACQSCGEYCTECTSNGCSTCLTDKFEATDNRACRCKINSILNSSQTDCEAITCGELCLGCRNTTSCETCADNAVDDTDGSCSCPDGYSKIGNACVADCDPSCKTCLVGVTTCDTCHPKATKNNSTLLCECNSGYTQNSDGTCTTQTCIDTCLTCSDTDREVCLSCHSNATLDVSTGKCGCNEHYEVESTTGKCMVKTCNETCGTCDKYQRDICLSCKANADLSGNTCSCQVGYSMAPVTGECIQCGNFFQSTEVSIYFSSTFNLIIEFSEEVDKTNVTSCQKAFTTATLAYFGTGAQCQWLPFTPLLKVVLGSDSTLVDQQVELLAGNFKKVFGPCNTASVIKKAPNLPSPLPKPTAVLEYPESYSKACTTEPLTLIGDASQGALGRPSQFKYKWTFAPGINISSSFLDFSATNSIIDIPNSSLNPGQLQVTLTVQNFLGETDQKIVTLNIDAGESLSLNIQGGGKQQMYASDKKKIPATAELCGSSSSSIVFNWTFEGAQSDAPAVNGDSVFNTPQNHILQIQPNVLTPGYEYYFKVTATQGSITGSSNLTILVLSQDLVAQLDIGDCDYPASADLEISGEGSYDPDESDQSMTYLWSCQAESGPCKDSNGGNLITDSINGQAVLKLESVRLAVGSLYAVKLTVSKGTRKAEALANVNVKAGGGTFMKVTQPVTKINVEQYFQVVVALFGDLSGYSFQWQQASGNAVSPITPLNNPYILFGPYSFQQGAGYSYQVQMSNPSYTFQALVPWTTNLGPRGGSFAVSPSTGTTDIWFKGKVEGFVDGDEEDYPLYYQYFVEDSGKTLALTGLWLSSVVYIKVYPGDFSIQVKVCDYKLTCTENPLKYQIKATMGRRLSEKDISQQYLEDTQNLDRVLNMAMVYPKTYSNLSSSSFNTIVQSVNSYQGGFDEINAQELSSYAGIANSLMGQDEMNQTKINSVASMIQDVLGKVNDTVQASQGEQILEGMIPYQKEFSAQVQPVVDKVLERLTSGTLPDATPIHLEFTNSDIINARTVGCSGDKKLIESSNITVGVKNTSLTCDGIFDLQVQTVTGQDNATVILKVFQAGNMDPQVNLSFTRLAVQSFNDSITVEVPLENPLDDSVNIECDTEGSSGCSVVALSNKLLQYTLTKTGTFSYRTYTLTDDTDQPPIDTPSTSNEDDNKNCITNFSPIYICAGIFAACILSIILGSIFDAIQNKRFNEAPASALPDLEQAEIIQQDNDTTVFQQVNSHNIQKAHSIISPSEIVTPSSVQTQAQCIPQYDSRSTFTDKFKICHLFLSLFVYESSLSRMLKALRFFSCLLFEFMALGLLYLGLSETDKEGDAVDFVEAFEVYEVDDFLWVLTAIGVGLPVGVALQCVLHSRSSINLRRKVAALISCAGLILSSTGVITYLSLSYCHEPSAVWSVGFLFLALIEIVIRQTLTGLIGALFVQIRQ